MADTQLLVTQALDERDLLIKKINDKIRTATLVDIIRNNEEKVLNSRIRIEEFKQQTTSSYQQILDLISRYNKLDAAIVESNANTYIETSYGRFSVAGAITLRNRMKGDAKFGGKADFESNLLEHMKSEYQDNMLSLERKNRELESTAESMRLSILGKEAKTKDEKPLAVVEAYLKENTMELADPINIVEKIKMLQEKGDKLRTELETQIKVSNATTFITIED